MLISLVPKSWLSALDELMRRKLRTTLTLLGVILGTAAIIAMLGIGEGSRREALKLVQTLGMENLIVESADARSNGRLASASPHAGLTVSDMLAAARDTPAVLAVAGFKSVQTWGIYSHDLPVNVDVAAVSPNYFPLTSLEISSGRLFTAVDEKAAAPVAVLGARSAERLFPGEKDVIGRLIKINHVAVRVVGILSGHEAWKNQFQGISLKDDSNTIFIPLVTGLVRFRAAEDDDGLDRLYFKVDELGELSSAAEWISKKLASRHNGAKSFSVIVPLNLYKQSQRTQRIFDIVMGSVAAVCLVVGGIGIMNIMLANVLERKREIGLFRAIGASRRDITRQFLRETLVVSCAGVVTGALVGVAAAYLVAYLSAWVIAWSVVEVVLCCLVCVMIATGFGVYPAVQAASLDPIAAIRAE